MCEQEKTEAGTESEISNILELLNKIVAGAELRYVESLEAVRDAAQYLVDVVDEKLQSLRGGVQ